jgi:ABC-type lipoprotein export system ATPase subunit
MKAKKRTYDEVDIISTPSVKTGNPVLDAFLSFELGFQLGNLIMMTGTSGAGKTTLCKLLQKWIKEPTNFHALESLASSVKRQTGRLLMKRITLTSMRSWNFFTKTTLYL